MRHAADRADAAERRSALRGSEAGIGAAAGELGRNADTEGGGRFPVGVVERGRFRGALERQELADLIAFLRACR